MCRDCIHTRLNCRSSSAFHYAVEKDEFKAGGSEKQDCACTYLCYPLRRGSRWMDCNVCTSFLLVCFIIDARLVLFARLPVSNYFT
jgi:hypothetical protein